MGDGVLASASLRSVVREKLGFIVGDIEGLDGSPIWICQVQAGVICSECPHEVSFLWKEEGRDSAVACGECMSVWSIVDFDEPTRTALLEVKRRRTRASARPQEDRAVGRPTAGDTTLPARTSRTHRQVPIRQSSKPRGGAEDPARRTGGAGGKRQPPIVSAACIREVFYGLTGRFLTIEQEAALRLDKSRSPIRRFSERRLRDAGMLMRAGGVLDPSMWVEELLHPGTARRARRRRAEADVFRGGQSDPGPLYPGLDWGTNKPVGHVPEHPRTDPGAFVWWHGGDQPEP
jgi:hypothetical protein